MLCCHLLTHLIAKSKCQHLNGFVVGPEQLRTEFQSKVSSSYIPSSYDFQSHSVSSSEPTKRISISDFRQTPSEQAAVQHLLTQAFSYCLIKNALPVALLQRSTFTRVSGLYTLPCLHSFLNKCTRSLQRLSI